MMQQIIEIAIFATTLALIFLLLFTIYRSKKNMDIVQAKLLQAYVDKALLSEKVATLAAEKDANALKEDDGFIKFLSNSRDWAFSYIEEVQSAIQEFKDKAGPPIQKLSGSKSADVKLITQAYKNLVEVLPEENEKGKANE
jgi:hypothetical protein